MGSEKIQELQQAVQNCSLEAEALHTSGGKATGNIAAQLERTWGHPGCWAEHEPTVGSHQQATCWASAGKNAASRKREITLCPSLMRLHLKHCVQV